MLSAETNGYYSLQKIGRDCRRKGEKGIEKKKGGKKCKPSHSEWANVRIAS